MSVAINATGAKGHSGSGTSFSYTGLTVAAGANSAIVLGIVWDAATAGTSLSVTWGSQAMTLIRAQAGASSGGCELWGLVGPATGNQTLSISWTGTSRLFCAAMAFDAVNQTGGATSFPHSTGATNVNPNNVTVTSATGNKVMACEQNNTGSNLLTGTPIYFDAASGAWVNASSNYDNGASSVTIGAGALTGTVVATDIAAFAGSTNYPLTAALGTYSLSGKAVGLTRGRSLTCAVGSYSLAIADLVTRALGLSEATGSYALSGSAATLTKAAGASTYTLACAKGAYTLAIADLVTHGWVDTPATGAYSLVAPGTVLRAPSHSIVCAAGTYALSGKAVTLQRASTLTAVRGTYSLSGKDVAFIYGGARSILALRGSYVLSGLPVALTKASRSTLACASGTYALSGKAVGLVRGRTQPHAAGTYGLAIADLVTTSGAWVPLTAAGGVYSVNGLAATLVRGSPLTLACATGHYSWAIADIVTITEIPLTTYALSVAKGSYTLAIADIITIDEFPSGTTYVLTCAKGAYTTTGAPSTRDFVFETSTGAYVVTGADGLRNFTVELGTGSYSVGIANLVSAEITVPLTGAAYVVTGKAATLTRLTGYQLTLGTGAYAVSGSAPTLAVAVPATTGAYTVSGKAAGLAVGRRLLAQSGSYGVAGQQAVLTYKPPGPTNYILAIATAPYVVSGKAAILTSQRKLLATTGAYVLSGQPVGLIKASSYTLTCVKGAYVVSGPSTTLAFGRVFAAAKGSFSVVGQPILVRRTYAAALDTGQYLVFGPAARLSWSGNPTPIGGMATNNPFIASVGAMMTR